MLPLIYFVLIFHFVSTNQYYVAETPDQCPSDGKGFPCHSLSKLANPSTFFFTNNTVFYFVPGSHSLNCITYFTQLRNVTLIGIKTPGKPVHHLFTSDQYFTQQQPVINCTGTEGGFVISNSSHINFFNLSIYDCYSYTTSSNNIYSLTVLHSSNITISGFSFYNFGLLVINGFDMTISSVITNNATFAFNYIPLDHCFHELSQYTLELIEVSIHNSPSDALVLSLHHNVSYKLVVAMNIISIAKTSTGSNIILQIMPSFYSLNLSNITSQSAYKYGLHVNFLRNDDDSRTSVQQYCNTLIEKPHNNFPQLIIIKYSIFQNNRLSGVLILQPVTKEINQLLDNITVVIRSSSINDNNAVDSFGLAVYTNLYNSLSIHIIKTSIENNKKNLISDCNSITFYNVQVINNIATGLIVSGSTITVNGSLLIQHNQGSNGAGIALDEGSSVLVYSNTIIEFGNNIATEKGGGLYVASKSPICPILPKQKHGSNIIIVFNANDAPFGADVYGLNFDTCSSNVQPKSNFLQTTDPIEIEFCYDTDVYQNIYPGQNIYFKLFMYGQGYRGLLSRSIGEITIKSSPSEYLLATKVVEGYCSPQYVTYIYNQSQKTDNELIISLPLFKHLANSPASESQGATELKLSFTLQSCPIGFELTQAGVCNCSQNLQWETSNIICDINNLTITHTGFQWIGLYNIPDNFSASHHYDNECILKEACFVYCSSERSSLTINDTDTQCIDNRAHRMCGSCATGYSLLLGSNKCGLCPNHYTLIWSLLFALLGIILVLLLIGLNLTVSVGTINGILFYANILKLYEPVFSKDGSLPVLSQFIAWINLDFGIEACFYNGLDRYIKEWLQFVFPFYLWLVIIIIISLCWISGKISRLVGTNAVPVLSTLFLLSYTKLVRTIVIVLHKREVTLFCGDTILSKTLWYEDPTVEYQNIKHVIQVIFAMCVFSLFIVPFTLFLLLNPLFEKYFSKYKICAYCNKIKPIIDAYSGPMRDEYRFWPGFLLVARLPVLLSVTLVDDLIESRSLLLSVLLSVLVIVFSLVSIFRGVYKIHLHNVIEVWFFFNLTLTVALAIVITDKKKSKLWYSTSIGVFIISFIGVTLYHLHLRLTGKAWYDRLLNKLHCINNALHSVETSDEHHHKTVREQLSETNISTTYIELRRNEDDESVIELFVDNN